MSGRAQTADESQVRDGDGRHRGSAAFPGSGALGADFIAGLSAACVALPLNLAIAVASDLPASVGIVSGVIAGVVAALFGGNRFQITGPEAALVPIVLLIARTHGLAGVVAATFLCGLSQIVLAALGAGRLVRFVPAPVITGFGAGIGALILVGQTPLLFGAAHGESLGSVFRAMAEQGPTAAQALGVGIGVVVIASLMLVRRFGILLGLALAVLAVVSTGADVRLVGALPATLPMPHLPDFGGLEPVTLLPQIVSLVLLASMGSLLSASALDRLTRGAGGQTRFDRELVAQGLANMASALFGGMPVMGAIVRSTAAVSAGAQTRATGVIQSLLLLVVMLTASSVVAKVPIAALAAVLLVVGVRLLQPRAIATLWSSDRGQALVLLATAAVSAAVNILVGVAVGLVLFVALRMRRHGWLRVAVRPLGAPDVGPLARRPGERMPDVRVVELQGPVLFVSCHQLDAIVDRAPWPDYVVVDVSGVPFMDATGMDVLRHNVACVEVRGGQVVLVGAGKRLEAVLRRTQLMDRMLGGKSHATLAEALISIGERERAKAASAERQGPGDDWSPSAPHEAAGE
jgi:sulfate permease, SulP family